MTAKEVIARCEQLKTIRSPHEWLWNEVGFLTNAKYFNNAKGAKTHGMVPHAEIYDTTLRTKSRMQANGITSMLFARDRDWVKTTPPWSMRKNKAAIKKYREAGEGLLHYLRASNFHHQNHGVITHRSQLGTGTMAMEWIDDDYGQKVMNFRKYEPMTYVIDHDSRTRVQTFACEYHWSAHRAAEEWGLKNLSSKMQQEALDINKRDQCHDFTMLIERRPKWEIDKDKGNKGMNYRVMVVEPGGQHTILESGNDVFQIVASRYEVFDSPWGYSPAWEVLPDGYKANYAAKFMMVMGERAAVPPVIAPASMKEEGIGLGAAEVTYVSDLNPNVWPRELSSGGNYTVGLEVWKMLRESIDEAFHGPLFSMFSRLQGDVTATQINAMQGEHNAQIDPTITALTKDHTEPVIRWAFNGLAEAGLIDLPDEARDEKTGEFHMPIFAYENAISLNHQRSKALEAMNLLDMMANLGGAGLPVDVTKVEETARRIWRDSGQNEDELMSEMEWQDYQEGKQQAAQQAQAMQAVPGAAKAAKDLSGAGVDLAGMMGGQ